MIALINSLLMVAGVIVCTLPIGLIVAAVTMTIQDSEHRNKNK